MTSPKPPQFFKQKYGETYLQARARFTRRWTEYRDYSITLECMHQATVCSSVKKRHFFKAFYGVELRFVEL